METVGLKTPLEETRLRTFPRVSVAEVPWLCWRWIRTGKPIPAVHSDEEMTVGEIREAKAEAEARGQTPIDQPRLFLDSGGNFPLQPRSADAREDASSPPQNNFSQGSVLPATFSGRRGHSPSLSGHILWGLSSGPIEKPT